MRALLCAAALACPTLVAAAVLELREQVLIEQPRVQLADVAAITGDAAGRLQALDLGSAPRVGYVQRWTRNELAELIRRRGAGEVEWQGAQQVQLRTASRLVDAAAMLAEAGQAMQAAFGAGGPLQLAPLAQPVEVEAPQDAQLVARPLAGRPLAPRMDIWLDLVWHGTVYRSVRVALSVQAMRELYVARRDLASGEAVGAEDFVRRQADAAQLGDAAPLALPGKWRMRHALRAGQALAASQVLVAGAVRRGEQVQVLWQDGGLRIERAGTALADAAPGGRVTVRMEGGAEVSGRVEQDGSVRVDRN